MNATGGTIVVAYSADRFGDAALEHGVALARRDGGRLVVVNATAGTSLVDARFAHDAEISALRERIEGDGVEVVVRHDVVDDVAEAVVGVADEEDAGVIVVGVRHRTAVGKLLLGSVAQRIILDARCPVLAVKPADRLT
ncbi:universal stress protein [Nocardioides caeni]|uniref:universal stress protein n=1 Tax=Nocardioides caeni TaxID=574700 RepID=UPI0018769F7B|nr:universal stress protein [Nocardioides caeni]